MDHQAVSELLTKWEIPIPSTIALVLVAIIYVVGWYRAQKTRPTELPRWRCAVFISGIVAIFVAISSPLDTLNESLLFMHMAQHFVLMSIAPPLIALGSPAVPLLRGTPRLVIKGLRPLFRSRHIHLLLRHSQRKIVAWLCMNVAYIGWHIPTAYEQALKSETWHNVEHVSFLFASLLFWWPVVCPWPSQRRGSPFILIPYLVLADVVNTALSAFLCFSGRVLYPSYEETGRPLGLSALTDQVASGALMWVFGSLAFLMPLAGLFLQWLMPAAVPDQDCRIVCEDEGVG